MIFHFIRHKEIEEIETEISKYRAKEQKLTKPKQKMQKLLQN